MTLLQLLQRCAIECSISGAASISTAQGITPGSSLGRILMWLNTAWAELQTVSDEWEWLRSSNILGAGASFTTVAGQASYPLGTGPGTSGIPVTSFGKYDRYSFRNYTTSAGTNNEWFLDWIDYDKWRNSYMLGAMRTVQTRPVAVAIGPDKSVCLGPPPNGLYTVTADYWMAPSQMSADIDVPVGLPAQYHMIIVYDAMRSYAGYESAQEVWDRADRGYRMLRGELEATYLPEIYTAGALA